MIKGVFDSIFAVSTFVSNSFNYLYQGFYPAVDKTEAYEHQWSNNKMQGDDESFKVSKRQKTQHQDSNNNKFLRPTFDWQSLRQYQNFGMDPLLIPHQKEGKQEEISVVFVTKEHVDPFNQFLDRLKGAKQLSHPRLNKLISKEDLLKIYDYFLLGATQSHSLSFVTRAHANQRIHLEKIKNLKPGEAYRLAKEDTQLPRTLNILRAKNGEFKLILETKSKLTNGKKQVLPKVGGSFKSGKPAWKIDGALTEYFNLVVEFDKDDELSEVKNEVKISEQLGCETVNKNELGQEYNKHGKRKISVYSEKAEGSLEDLLSDKVQLTAQQKHIMIQDLLDAVKRFHDSGYVHQDIKPANILFVKNEKNEYRLKITDYGLTKMQHDVMANALASAGYHSPEIALIHSNPKSEFHDYFNSTEAKNTLGSWYAKSMQPKRTLRFEAPHHANDMWALGIVIYKILHGRAPLLSRNNPNINKNLLLKGLLASNRDERIDIEAAIQIHAKTPVVEEKECSSERKRKHYKV